MAITNFIAKFLARGLREEAFGPGGEILEFGEANVAASSDILDLLKIVEPHIPQLRLDEALRQLEEAKRSLASYRQDSGPARAFYHAVFAPSFYMAVELGVAPRRLCVDLNGPVNIGRQFDIVINNGTCQHVFDQANFYRVMHESTRPGGVMMHWTPTIGWINHGLYTIQPGFFFDLAAANDYRIKLIGLMSDDVFFPLSGGEAYRDGLALHPSLQQAVMGAILEKTTDAPFRPPIQGAFSDADAVQYALARSPRRYIQDTRPNLALNRPATQSSTGRASWHEDPALDAAGAVNSMITGFYSFCTDLQPEPWWSVDLGAPVPIQEVVVYNRIDTFPRGPEVAAYLQVSLSQDGETWSRVYERHEQEAFGGADGNPLRVLIYGRVARFVRLSLPGVAFLSLDEVEVY